LGCQNTEKVCAKLLDTTMSLIPATSQIHPKLFNSRFTTALPIPRRSHPLSASAVLGAFSFTPFTLYTTIHEALAPQAPLSPPRNRTLHHPSPHYTSSPRPHSKPAYAPTDAGPHERPKGLHHTIHELHTSGQEGR